MDGTKGAHHGHADKGASNDYGDENKCHGAPLVIDYTPNIIHAVV